MNLETVRALCREFEAGAVSRDALQANIADARMQLSPREPDSDERRSPEEILALSIGESFCRFQEDDEAARLFARRVLLCIEQISDVEDVIDLLPALIHHDRFAIIVSKYSRGLITRNGFRSVVAKTFTSDSVRPWLEQASQDRLCALLEAIEQEQFQVAHSILTLPPA